MVVWCCGDKYSNIKLTFLLRVCSSNSTVCLCCYEAHSVKVSCFLVTSLSKLSTEHCISLLLTYQGKCYFASALTLLVGRQEEHAACKK